MTQDPLRRLDRFFTSAPPEKRPARPSLQFQSVGGAELMTRQGSTLVISRNYAWDALPGAVSWEAVRREGWRPASMGTQLPEATALDRLACVDIETTGLSLGAGTVAFLVGVIHAREDGLVLKQFLIRDFPEEAAQQLLLAEHLSGFEVVCTYNGARFDLPILRSRSVIHRIDADWLSRPHLDLLYPVRSVWRALWPDCRLATAEFRLLGVVRQGDCESWEVPLRFRQFLADPSETLIQDVLEHNAQDLLSLLSLTAVVQRLFREDFDGFGLTQSELLGLARWLSARGRREAGLRVYDQAFALGRLAPEFGRHMKYYVRLLKKRSLWSEARRVWLELSRAGDDHDRLWALLEEAKFMEHHERLWSDALAATRQAQSALEALPHSPIRDRLEAEIDLRRDRLLRRQKAA